MEFGLSNAQAVKDTLVRNGLSPQKYLGQNFLLSTEVTKKIAKAVEVKDIDNLVEIGPGLGILTQELLQKQLPLLAIEKDIGLANYLRKNFAHHNLRIKTGDILKVEKIFSWGALAHYSIAANLPYQITARFLKFFLSEVDNKPQQLVLMLQREVAKRLTAAAGNLTKLGLLAQVYARPKILFLVPAKLFYPQPKVNSAVVDLSLKSQSPFSCPQDEVLFWRLVRIGFASRRKTLANNLMNGLHLKSPEVRNLLTLAKFNPKIRAQSLSVNDWQKMVDIYKQIY